MSGSSVGNRRRRWPFVGAVLMVIAAGVAAGAVGGCDPGRGSGGSNNEGSATSLVTVHRRTLSQTTEFNGTLGFAGSYTVLSNLPGIVTWLPRPGQVIHQGQVLYRVDGTPVVLLYGATPAYRTLAAGSTAADVTGADVEQLNHDLVALGYLNRSDAEPAWNRFNWATTAGLEKLQHHLGVEQTGTLDLGAVVFLPTAARVTNLQATLGAPAAGSLLQASSTARTVSVALDPSLQAAVKVGDRVTISLPDGGVTPGRVSSVGRVATMSSNDSSASGSSNSGPTVAVHIRPTRLSPAETLDQALVEVAITDQTVRNVLSVPVNALVALAGGGDAVEIVADDSTHHLVRVTPGLFDDAAGMVQVSGPDLAAGQRAVVPGR